MTDYYLGAVFALPSFDTGIRTSGTYLTGILFYLPFYGYRSHARLTPEYIDRRNLPSNHRRIR